MEIKKRFDLRMVVAVLYFVAFSVYLAVGLAPAEATNYEISAELLISAIDLRADVTALKLTEQKLNTPEKIVGSFARNDSNTLLIGHASTVFRELGSVRVGDEVSYDDDIYTVREVEILKKDEINMNILLSEQAEKTLTIMTCAGEELTGGDATERLIIRATL